MTNIRNFGIAEGRLTRSPKVFTNKDGSRKIMITLAVQDNFKSGEDKKKKSQFISLEGLVPAEKADNGVYEYMAQGSLVALEYTVRSKQYTDKDGKEVYDQVLFIQNVDLKESKAQTEQRMAAQAASAAQAAPAPVAGEAAEEAPFAK